MSCLLVLVQLVLELHTVPDEPMARHTCTLDLLNAAIYAVLLTSLQDHANIPVPPSKKDFVMVGDLQKRRGGFARIASQSWKKRCFVLLKTGNLAYFEVT